MVSSKYHYTSALETRFGEDGNEYTYDEFEEEYGKEAWSYWEAAKLNIPTKYILYICVEEGNPILKKQYEDAIKKWNDKMWKSKFPDAGFDVYSPLGGMCGVKDGKDFPLSFEGMYNSNAEVSYFPDNHEKHYDSNKHKVSLKLGEGKCQQLKMNFMIKTAMYKYKHGKYIPVSFTTHPRSSIYKTPLRITNSTGIIDSGYRGNLMGVFDVLSFYKINYAEGLVVPMSSFKNEMNKSWEDYKINKNERFIQICAPGLEPFIVELVDTPEDLSEETARGDKGFGSSGK